MKPPIKTLEDITVRRATVVDSDKVRYRVYSNAREFVAVIADSALMAVRVSGVQNPYKIMRDHPTDGIAIEAKKMMEKTADAEQVTIHNPQESLPTLRMAELPAAKNEEEVPFVPMAIGELQKKGARQARILPPDMVYDIITEHTRSHAPASPEAGPVAEMVPASAESEPEDVFDVNPPTLTPEERVSLLANDILPSAADLPPKPETPVPTLSQDDVEKLLNG